MASLIKTDGTITTVHPKAGIGKSFSLEELQGYVGGYIEIVYTANGKLCVVNEEGRLMRLQPNPRASLVTGYDLVGDALICENHEVE